MWFSPREGDYEYDVRFVDAETAVKRAHSIINSVGGRAGFISRVIITDGGDCITFEWDRDHGIVFPTKEDLGK